MFTVGSPLHFVQAKAFKGVNPSFLFFLCVSNHLNNFNPFLVHILWCITTETGYASSPPAYQVWCCKKESRQGGAHWFHWGMSLKTTAVSTARKWGLGSALVTCTSLRALHMDLHKTTLKLTVPDPEENKKSFCTSNTIEWPVRFVKQVAAYLLDPV